MKMKKDLSENSKAYYGLNNYYELFSQAEDYPKLVLNKIKEIAKDKVVLDAGCGSGKFISDIQHIAKELHGVDASEEQLDIARTKITSNTQLLCSDLEKLQY
ncbi:MAG: class I SAM-dependent methyltransferase, partial [Bacilli bacterium]|nr:class I SAM-dependent methyltransferase [Bacilli bacterium]